MKKMLIVFGFLFVVALTSTLSVHAAETTNTDAVSDELPKAGVKPGQFFYGVDKFFENVALKLTFSDEKKAEKLSKIAEERLAELNELDEEKAALYADELFNEYGINLEKAHLYVLKLVAEGKVSEDKINKLEERVIKSEKLQSKLSEKAKEQISNEVKIKVAETIKNAKMSIFSRFEDMETISILHNEGYGYGELLILQSIASISNKTIDELIAIEGVITTNADNEKEINFDLLLETLNITSEQVREQLRNVQDSAKETMKSKIDEANNRGNQNNAKQNGKK